MFLPRLLPVLLLFPLYAQAAAIGKPLDCVDGNFAADSLEGLICATPQLARYDRQLAWTYRRAMSQTRHEDSYTLRRHHNKWLEQRNHACWYTLNRLGCLRDSYRHRIAELQARFALIASAPPRIYQCDDPSRSTLTLSFFPSDPPTLILQRKDDLHLLFASVHQHRLQYQGEEYRVREGRGGLLLQWPGLPREAGCVLSGERASPTPPAVEAR